MVSTTAISCTSPGSSHSSLFVKLSKHDTFSPIHIKSKLRNKNEGNRSLHCVCSSRSGINSIPQIPSFSCSSSTTSVVVTDKLNFLVSEFKSLSEPIDRVKRLLHFAALLPPLEASARVPENRVTGCTTQVWLIAEMDECGRMKFRADSDSEISKGFCSCLIWMLDGAEPEEVLMVEAEDLADMNVGLHVRAQSRVNTWHNVLFSMQKATKALIVDMERKKLPKAFPSVIATVQPDGCPNLVALVVSLYMNLKLLLQISIFVQRFSLKSPFKPIDDH